MDQPLTLVAQHFLLTRTWHLPSPPSTRSTKPPFFSCFAPAAATYGRSPVWWAIWHRFLYPSGGAMALGPWCQCACEATGSTIPVFLNGAAVLLFSCVPMFESLLKMHPRDPPLVRPSGRCAMRLAVRVPKRALRKPARCTGTPNCHATPPGSTPASTSATVDFP